LSFKRKNIRYSDCFVRPKRLFGLSMRELAQAVDMSVAAIYHHFPIKKRYNLESVRFAFSDKEQFLPKYGSPTVQQKKNWADLFAHD